MDVQRKKGILEVCVLAVLKKGPSYGYMIIREMEQCVEISESTLYPILKRLEQNGSLTTHREEYNGRMRKYYQLTEEGQQKIDQFLDEWDELQTMYSFVKEWNERECLGNASDSGREAEKCQEAAESVTDSGREAEQCQGAAESASDSVQETEECGEATEGTLEEKCAAWEASETAHAAENIGREAMTEEGVS